MKLDKLASEIGAKTLAGGDREVKRVFAGDRVSDILAHAAPEMLVVTNLTGVQLVRVAGIMDVAGLCLLNGAEPEAPLVQSAAAQGTGVLVSPAGMFETCGRIHRLLGEEACSR